MLTPWPWKCRWALDTSPVGVGAYLGMSDSSANTTTCAMHCAAVTGSHCAGWTEARLVAIRCGYARVKMRRTSVAKTRSVWFFVLLQEGAERVRSPFSGDQLEAKRCSVDKLVTNPQIRGNLYCLCDPGWGPEYIGDPKSPTPGLQKCNKKIPCVTPGSFEVTGTVAADGYCKCFGDYYDSRTDEAGAILTAPGSCTGNCRFVHLSDKPCMRCRRRRRWR